MSEVSQWFILPYMELRGSWEENVSLFLLYVPLVLSPDPAHSQGKDLVISGSFIG